MSLTLRKATLADSALLFRWRNEPETVLASIVQKPVTEAEHDRWLIKVLSDKTWHLYIAENNWPRYENEPEDFGKELIGMGRLQEVGPHRAVVSYSVDAHHRVRGFGGQIVAALCVKALELGYTSLRADARRESTASIRALLAAGFEFSPVELLTLEKNAT
jgi:RimJ/RimL family protein N-acetyltransferase